jgi:hypothetical protein
MIAVMDRPRSGSPVPDRHLQRVDDQFGAQVVGHCPTDDAAAEAVDDDRQIEPALGGGVLGDVGDVEPVRPRRRNRRSTRSCDGVAASSRRVQPVSRRR